jgi:hypothetical protein
METGLSSPAHREDESERLPDREAHFIIVPETEADDISRSKLTTCMQQGYR